VFVLKLGWGEGKLIFMVKLMLKSCESKKTSFPKNKNKGTFLDQFRKFFEGGEADQQLSNAFLDCLKR